jgi:hypothetical protein
MSNKAGRSLTATSDVQEAQSPTKTGNWLLRDMTWSPICQLTSDTVWHGMAQHFHHPVLPSNNNMLWLIPQSLTCTHPTVLSTTCTVKQHLVTPLFVPHSLTCTLRCSWPLRRCTRAQRARWCVP